MKPTQISFLFIVFLWSNLGLVNAQETDSLSYYITKASNPKQPEDLASAYQYFEKATATYQNKKQTAKEVYHRQFMADIRRTLGYYDESETLNLQNLALLEDMPDSAWKSEFVLKIVNELGRINRSRKDYDEALKIYKRALKLVTTDLQRSIIQNNIGILFLRQELFLEAQKYFDTAYKLALQTDNSKQMARSLDNLSYTKSKLKDPSAEAGLLEALAIREAQQYPYGMATSYEHLIDHYQLQQEPLKAEAYLEQYLSLAKKTGIAELSKNALEAKVSSFEIPEVEAYIKISDSLSALNDQARNDFNYYVYRYDKKEKDLIQTRADKERLFFILILLVVLAVSLYFILTYKHRKDKFEQVYQTETRISRKIHDEVANDVYHVMTKLQHNSSSNEALLDDLEDLYKRTRDISREHSSIDLDTSFAILLKDLLLGYHNSQTRVIIKGLQDLNWEKLNDLKKATLYRVLQELLTNMKKHSEARVVVMGFEEEAGAIIIKYADNGKGTQLQKANGLQNTENRIASINGSINFETAPEKGFKATIKI